MDKFSNWPKKGTMSGQKFWLVWRLSLPCPTFYLSIRPCWLRQACLSRECFRYFTIIRLSPGWWPSSPTLMRRRRVWGWMPFTFHGRLCLKATHGREAQLWSLSAGLFRSYHSDQGAQRWLWCTGLSLRAAKLAGIGGLSGLCRY